MHVNKCRLFTITSFTISIGAKELLYIRTVSKSRDVLSEALPAKLAFTI
jgi:hypothetical protein